MWREQRTPGTFPAYTRGHSSARPDHGNRYYFRGSRGARGGGLSTRTAPGFPPEADMKEGLDTSKIIETIPAPARLSAPEQIPIENTRYLASYNWVDREQPTIVVPGSPPVWTGHDLPFSLQPDDGSNFVDQNEARITQYPLLPILAAADAIHDKNAPVDWPTVDVVTDRNSLRKLLRWLNPSEGREVRDFRIDVEHVGAKTIVLSRWESRIREPPTGRSFGFAFEAATSRAAPGCPISGHYRAITYDMLDLKMIVRFEVDACFSTETTDSQSSSKEAPSLAVDDLADALGSITISSSDAPPASSPSLSPASVDIIHAGTQVPQDALLEVTSRSVNYIDQLDWNELYPQLAISQTATLHLGVHQRGTFEELREWKIIGGADGARGTGDGAGAGADQDQDQDQDADPDADPEDPSSPPDLTTQRRETAAQFVRLARVLEDVQELARLRGPGPAGCFSLVCEDGEMCVYGRKGAKSCLPPEMKARFSVAGAGAGADV